jgi:hypothetical protein
MTDPLSNSIGFRSSIVVMCGTGEGDEIGDIEEDA